MEPSLNDISDYNQPISRDKKKMIFGAFGIAIAIYIAYSLIMMSFS